METAYSGRQALEKFIENRAKTCCDLKYKLVLMDINLPNDEGFDVTKQMLEHQRTVKLGRKRENKKKMLNNYLLSIQGSEMGSEAGSPSSKLKKQSTIKSGFRRITVQKMEGSSKSNVTSESNSFSESEMASLKDDFVVIADDKR